MSSDQQLEWLDADRIRLGLSAVADSTLQIEVVDITGSTQQDLMDRAAAGETVDAVVRLAEQQQSGRGRRNRDWQSPRGCNLYLTLAWRFEVSPDALVGLSLGIGAGIAEALAATPAVELSLKWPNDLFLNNRKCGGILVDISPVRAGGSLAFVGVGINIDMSSQQVKGVSQPWTDLSTELGYRPSRNEVAVQVIAAIQEVLTRFPEEGFEAWLPRWRDRDFLRGKALTVSAGKTVSGHGAGVSEEGALLVDTGAGVVPVWAGEVIYEGKVS